jgi:hypothetical protein
LWDLFELCWTLEPTSRPDVQSVMASHKRWHVKYAHNLEQNNQGEGIYADFSSSEDTKVTSDGTRNGSDSAEPLSPIK